MDKILANKETRKDLYRVYGATLFFALHVVLITYINSTYLEQFIPAKTIGLLYTIGAILGLVMLSRMSHFMRVFGNRALMITLAIIEIGSLLLMAYSNQPYVIIFFFIIHQTMIPMLYMTFDVFIEFFSTIEDAGRARGTFLSIINGAYVVVPMITGFILFNSSFTLVYTCSLLLLIPLIISIYFLKHFEDPHYREINPVTSVNIVLRNKDIRSVVIINLILQMFYACMVIYMPIYLHETIGFDWGSIGIMFTVMLTPFVLFEFPLGRISDAFLGEKEILILGLFIMAGFTAWIPFMDSTSIISWTVLLFMTRVGASFVEIMVESYFFKKITREESHLLQIWRSLDGISYIIMPTAISILLFVIGANNLAYIFLIMGLICLVGVTVAMRIKDTL